MKLRSNLTTFSCLLSLLPIISATAILSSEVLEAQFFPEISKRVQVRYGPYEVPPMSKDNGMKEWIESQAPKPCQSCLITFFKADIEYVDGTPANVDTGLWLHHTVSTTTNKRALTCGENSRGDRFFSGGNERSAFDLTANGTQKVGYYVQEKDNFATLTELMNMKDEVQQAFLTMTYEYVPLTAPGFEKAIPLWMDISECDPEHELPLHVKTGNITYNSKEWTSKKNYRIAANIGHLHDGGVNHLTLRNNQIICNSVAVYGEDPAYVNSAMPGMQHISRMESCPNQGYFIPGDRISVSSFYDLDQHPPMVDADGSIEPIMGISWIWMVEDENIPLPDKVRWQAGLLAESANQHGMAYGVVVLLVLLVGGFSFWLGRRRGRKVARLGEKDEETYRLGEVGRDYRD